MSMCVSKSGSMCIRTQNIYTQTNIHAYIYAHTYIKQD